MDIAELVYISSFASEPLSATTLQAPHVNLWPIPNPIRNKFQGGGIFTDFKIVNQSPSSYIIFVISKNIYHATFKT